MRGCRQIGDTGIHQFWAINCIYWWNDDKPCEFGVAYFEGYMFAGPELCSPEITSQSRLTLATCLVHELVQGFNPQPYDIYDMCGATRMKWLRFCLDHSGDVQNCTVLRITKNRWVSLSLRDTQIGLGCDDFPEVFAKESKKKWYLW
jgi:hypothetical protein